jgi:hypothetical protein
MWQYKESKRRKTIHAIWSHSTLLLCKLRSQIFKALICFNFQSVLIFMWESRTLVHTDAVTSSVWFMVHNQSLLCKSIRVSGSVKMNCNLLVVGVPVCKKETRHTPKTPMIARSRRYAGSGVRIAVWFRCNLSKVTENGHNLIVQNLACRQSVRS